MSDDEAERQALPWGDGRPIRPRPRGGGSIAHVRADVRPTGGSIAAAIDRVGRVPITEV